MRVRELIDFLRVQDPEAEVELTIVESDPQDESTLGVTRYPIVEVMTVPASVDDELDEELDDDEGPQLVWLVGGEESDVDDFLDAIEGDADFDED